MPDSEPPPPIDFSELPTVPGGWREQQHLVAGRCIRLAQPNDPDSLLDDPATLRESESNGYTPYWSWLWPSAKQMAEVLPDVPIDRHGDVLELGCGLGLVGVAGLLAGLSVVMTDYREEAVRVASFNARLNGFARARTQQVDWTESAKQKFPTVLGCDVLYDRSSHRPLIRFLDSALVDGGTCWIGDPGRQHAAAFVQACSEHFEVDLFDDQLSPLSEPRARFQLIRLRAASR